MKFRRFALATGLACSTTAYGQLPPAPAEGKHPLHVPVLPKADMPVSVPTAPVVPVIDVPVPEESPANPVLDVPASKPPMAKSNAEKPVDPPLLEATTSKPVIVQVESAEAIDHVAEIAAVDGIDLVFIGPRDLSATLGKLNQFDDPAVQAERTDPKGNPLKGTVLEAQGEALKTARNLGDQMNKQVEQQRDEIDAQSQ